jgi:hypothetical protein
LKFDPTVAAGPAKFQDSFKIGAEQLPEVQGGEATESNGTCCDENDLGVWLGVRDDFRNWVMAQAA